MTGEPPQAFGANAAIVRAAIIGPVSDPSQIGHGLPGSELVERGLADLRAGVQTEASLLVAMAAPRLRALGFDVPDGGGDRPSHRLYELISQTSDSPHSRYNALVGRITSFARAAEHAASR